MTSGHEQLESNAWNGMRGSHRLQVFYRIAFLLPILGLALAAVVRSVATGPEPALAYGGRSIWIYPPFLLRGLLAYGVVIAWLHRQLRRRSLAEFETLLWQAPIAYLAASTALLGALVLTHGQAATFADDQRWIGLRLAVHLAIGYGYLGLIVWARNTLRESGYFVEAVPLGDLSAYRRQALSTDTGS